MKAHINKRNTRKELKKETIKLLKQAKKEASLWKKLFTKKDK